MRYDYLQHALFLRKTEKQIVKNSFIDERYKNRYTKIERMFVNENTINRIKMQKNSSNVVLCAWVL